MHSVTEVGRPHFPGYQWDRWSKSQSGSDARNFQPNLEHKIPLFEGPLLITCSILLVSVVAKNSTYQLFRPQMNSAKAVKKIKQY